MVAKDALGNDVLAATWLRTHKAGDRSLVQVRWWNKPFEVPTHFCIVAIES